MLASARTTQYCNVGPNKHRNNQTDKRTQRWAIVAAEDSRISRAVSGDHVKSQAVLEILNRLTQYSEHQLYRVEQSLSIIKHGAHPSAAVAYRYLQRAAADARVRRIQVAASEVQPSEQAVGADAAGSVETGPDTHHEADGMAEAEADHWLDALPQPAGYSDTGVPSLRAAADSEQRLKVMSINVNNKLDPVALGEYLRRTDVDIAGLQEHNLYFVDQSTGECHIGEVAQTAADVLRSYGYHLLLSRYVAMAISLDVWPTFEHQALLRSPCGRAMAAQTADGTRIVNVYAYQVSHDGNRIVGGQLGVALHDWIHHVLLPSAPGKSQAVALRGHAILLGDLQETITQTSKDNWGDPIPRSDKHSILTLTESLGMCSAYREVCPDTSIVTRRPVTGAWKRCGRFIDHVLGSAGLSVHSANVDMVDARQTMLSDHDPIWAVFHMPVLREATVWSESDLAEYHVNTAIAQHRYKFGVLAGVSVAQDTGKCWRAGDEYWCTPPKTFALLTAFQKGMHSDSAMRHMRTLLRELDSLEAGAAQPTDNTVKDGHTPMAVRTAEVRTRISRCLSQLILIVENAIPSKLCNDPRDPGPESAVSAGQASRDEDPGFVLRSAKGPAKRHLLLEAKLRQLSAKLAYTQNRAHPDMDGVAQGAVVESWRIVRSALGSVAQEITAADELTDVTVALWSKHEAEAAVARSSSGNHAKEAKRREGMTSLRQEMSSGTRSHLYAPERTPSALAHLSGLRVPTDGNMEEWSIFQASMQLHAPVALVWLRRRRRSMARTAKAVNKRLQLHQLRMNEMKGVFEAAGTNAAPSPPPPRQTSCADPNASRGASNGQEYVEFATARTVASMRVQGPPLPCATPVVEAGVRTYEYNDDFDARNIPASHLRPPQAVPPVGGEDSAGTDENEAEAGDSEEEAEVRAAIANLADSLKPPAPNEGMQWPFGHQMTDGAPVFNTPEALKSLRQEFRGPLASSRHAGFHLQVVARAHHPDEDMEDNEGNPPNWAMDALLRIIALSLTYRVLPDPARPITRHPIPKPDGGERPISVTHSAYAAISGTVAKYMTAQIETAKVLPDSVHSYRPEHGTWMCLFSHTAAVEDAIRNGKSLYVLSDDWEKFYDSVPLDVIILCLRAGGCPAAGYAEWAAEVMHDRGIWLSTPAGLSKRIQHDCGFLQGSAFSCCAVNFVVAALHRIWQAGDSNGYNLQDHRSPGGCCPFPQ